MRAVTLSVPTIQCAACVDNIRLYLDSEPGVAQVLGDASAKEVTVQYRPDTVALDQIETMIERLGHSLSRGGAE